jgi:hypothetical protein
LLALCFCSSGTAISQEIDPVHWAFASYFGTGRYVVDDRVDTFILSFTPGWERREASLTEDGERELGIRFRLPVAVGVHDFSPSDFIGDLDLDDVGTVSVVPGVEIEIPVTERFRLKTLSYLGWGSELGSSRSAIIHWLGLRSQLRFELSDTEMFLVNELSRVGYSSNSSVSGSVVPLMAGLDFRRRLKNKQIGGEPLYINWHVAYTNYLDGLNLDLRDRETTAPDIGKEWQLGFAFSKGDQRLRLWRLSWDRVGLSFRLDSGGDFSGVSIVFGSLFDR